MHVLYFELQTHDMRSQADAETSHSNPKPLHFWCIRPCGFIYISTQTAHCKRHLEKWSCSHTSKFFIALLKCFCNPWVQILSSRNSFFSLRCFPKIRTNPPYEFTKVSGQTIWNFGEKPKCVCCGYLTQKDAESVQKRKRIKSVAMDCIGFLAANVVLQTCHFRGLTVRRLVCVQQQVWSFEMEVGPTRVSPIQDSNRLDPGSVCVLLLLDALLVLHALQFFFFFRALTYKKLQQSFQRLEGTSSHWIEPRESINAHRCCISCSISLGALFIEWLDQLSRLARSGMA